MAHLVSASAIRVLADGRGKLTKMGENPPRHDTFYLDMDFRDVSMAAGDVAVNWVKIVPPDSFGSDSTITSKLTNMFLALKSAHADALDFKSLSISRTPFNSNGTSQFATATGNHAASHITLAPETAYFAPTADAGGTHALASAANVMLIERKIANTATQLTVKPLDVLVVVLTLTVTGTTRLVGGDLCLEFTRGSI